MGSNKSKKLVVDYDGVSHNHVSKRRGSNQTKQKEKKKESSAHRLRDGLNWTRIRQGEYSKGPKH